MTVKKMSILIVSIFLSAVVALSFQNCSNVRLQQPTATLASYSKSVDATYCSKNGAIAGQPTRFLFIVDMSKSNIGQYNGGTFDTSQGTDLPEARFNAIRDFINTCGAGAGNTFTVFGFSSTPVSSSGSTTCDAITFSSPAAALAQVEALRTIQQTDKAGYVSNPLGYKGKMLETNYSASFSCAETVLSQDIMKQTNPSSLRYRAFFLTDGYPEGDSACTGVLLTDPNCYGTNLNTTVNRIKSTGASLRVQPVFYGSTVQLQTATPFLQALANAGRVPTFIDVRDTTTLKDKLCSQVDQSVPVEYRKLQLSIININAKMVKGRLLPDTDGDGVPDALESGYGFDPSKRRTNGKVLDSICLRKGGRDLCAASIPSGCNFANENAFGVNDCEIKMMSLDGGGVLSAVQSGVDTDRDGIPDIVEVVRDTNPLVSDTTDDVDGDQVNNVTELNRGSQVDYYDPNPRVEDLVSFSEVRIPSNSKCPANQEVWSLSVDHLPLVSVPANPLPAGSAEPKMTTYHAADENVFWITYQTEPQNLSGDYEIWGTAIKVPLSAQKDFYRHLDPDDFVLLGTVKK